MNNSNGPADFVIQQKVMILETVKKHLLHEIRMLNYEIKLLSKSKKQDNIEALINEMIKIISDIDLNSTMYPECQLKEVKLCPHSEMFDMVKEATALLYKGPEGFVIKLRHDIALSGSYINFINLRRLVAMAYIDTIAKLILLPLDNLLSSGSLSNSQRERIKKTRMKFSNMLQESAAKGEITAMHIALIYILSDIRSGLANENQVLEDLYHLGVLDCFPSSHSTLDFIQNLLSVEDEQLNAIEMGNSLLSRSYNKKKIIINPLSWFGVKQVELDDFLMPLHPEVQLKNSFITPKKLNKKEMHNLVYNG